MSQRVRTLRFPRREGMWRRRRDWVLEQIRAAFAGVSREGGISLRQAAVIDHWGSAEAEAAARALDTDTAWTGVPGADIEAYPWSLTFLDPIGFRYYLPAYMCWTVQHPDANSASGDSTFFHLTPSDQAGDWQRERFRRFNPEQSAAIAAYLRYMRAAGERAGTHETLPYWGRFGGRYRPDTQRRTRMLRIPCW